MSPKTWRRTWTLLAVAWLVAPWNPAGAHGGEDVPLSHVLVELGIWTAGLAAALVVLVLLWGRFGRGGNRDHRSE